MERLFERGALTFLSPPDEEEQARDTSAGDR
jgi:hypothetical protein